MVEVKAQAGSNTLSDWLRKCRDAAGEVRASTEGANVSAQDFPGSTVGRLHPLVSLQYKLNMMLLRWEGMKRCVEFWIKVMRIDEERLMKVVMLKALEMEVKVEWVQNLEESLRMFGWGGMSSEALGDLSMGK